jgi:lambda repressor-like predicted transcriptional regulator
MASITRPETLLKRALKEQGRMQNWLAAQVGCDPSDISNYVRGLHVPSERRRELIADALGMQISDLWPEADEQKAAA